MAQAKTLLITSCTLRKMAAQDDSVSPDGIVAGSLPVFARRWASRVNRSRTRRPAVDLYAGRAFSEMRHLRAHLSASLHIVSAGLGLVHESQSIPNYDFTVVQGPGSIRSQLLELGVRVEDWWSALNEEFSGDQHPLTTLIKKTSADQVLIALPASYVCLVRADLSELPAKHVSKVRLFTSRAGRSFVPSHLAAAVMPYDERLESTRHAGTRADFPQRATRHFVEDLRAVKLRVNDAHAIVDRAMSGLSHRVLPMREKRSDEEVRHEIRANWKRLSGHQGQLLRHLRDIALVQCEQRRFKELWKTVRTEFQHTEHA